ncbi:P66B protein, partial [Molothrus ater]|nr:P66B protein [Molothrus ater]
SRAGCWDLTPDSPQGHSVIRSAASSALPHMLMSQRVIAPSPAQLQGQRGPQKPGLVRSSTPGMSPAINYQPQSGSSVPCQRSSSSAIYTNLTSQICALIPNPRRDLKSPPRSQTPTQSQIPPVSPNPHHDPKPPRQQSGSSAGIPGELSGMALPWELSRMALPWGIEQGGIPKALKWGGNPEGWHSRGWHSHVAVCPTSVCLSVCPQEIEQRLQQQAALSPTAAPAVPSVGKQDGILRHHTLRQAPQPQSSLQRGIPTSARSM